VIICGKNNSNKKELDRISRKCAGFELQRSVIFITHIIYAKP
jgi:hypothetical protein